MSQTEEDTKRAASRTFESGAQRRSTQTAEDTRRAQSRTKRDGGHSKGGREASGNIEHASMRTRERNAGLYNTTLGRDGRSMDGDSQPGDGSIATESGDDFYAPPRVVNGQPPAAFEFGGQNPPMPTGDTIGGRGSGGASTHALQIVKIDDTTVAVRRGSVDSKVVKLMGTELDVDHTQNTISVSGATTWKLVVTVDTDGEVTSADIQTGSLGATTDTNYEVEFGSVAWESNAIKGDPTSNLRGSQSHASCGTTHWMGAM